jgi:uncharacterized membrane protein
MLAIALAVVMMIAGLMHFVSPGVYLRIVPLVLPFKKAIVLISGLAEMALGAGLLYEPLRRLAAWGLIALYVAVFPANVSQALRKIPFGKAPLWTTWARLPLQVGFIAWAYALT